MTCRIIHQMWDDVDMPESCRSYADTWTRHNPKWEYMLWSNDNIQELLDSDYGWFRDTYNNYEYDICRWDAARYFILHKYGGLYCDVDIECFRSVDDLFKEHPVVFDENPGDYNESVLTNSIYYTLPGCRFMHRCMKHLSVQVAQRKPRDDPNKFVIRSTGPEFMTAMYYKWKHITGIEHKSHIHFERLRRDLRAEADSSYVPEKDEYGIHRSMGTWVM